MSPEELNSESFKLFSIYNKCVYQHGQGIDHLKDLSLKGPMAKESLFFRVNYYDTVARYSALARFIDDFQRFYKKFIVLDTFDDFSVVFLHELDRIDKQTKILKDVSLLIDDNFMLIYRFVQNLDNIEYTLRYRQKKTKVNSAEAEEYRMFESRYFKDIILGVDSSYDLYMAYKNFYKDDLQKLYNKADTEGRDRVKDMFSTVKELACEIEINLIVAGRL